MRARANFFRHARKLVGGIQCRLSLPTEEKSKNPGPLTFPAVIPDPDRESGVFSFYMRNSAISWRSLPASAGGAAPRRSPVLEVGRGLSERSSTSLSLRLS